MRFDGESTLFTPPEAAFVEGACARYYEDSEQDAVRLKVRSATLDYIYETLPAAHLDRMQGVARYPFLRMMAVDSWQQEDGETIRVNLDCDELAIVRDVAINEVDELRYSAGNINADFAASATLDQVLYPEDAAYNELSSEEEDSMKAFLFEEKLRSIEVGSRIIDLATKRISE